MGVGRLWRHGRDVGIPIVRFSTFVRGCVTLALACAFLSVVCFSVATITSAQTNVSTPDAPAYVSAKLTTFKCGFNAVAAALAQCQAAPAAGLKLYIRTLQIQTTTATSGTYALQTGTGTNCATGTAALFPSSGTANRFNAVISSNGMQTITFDPPLDAPAAAALCVIGVATNTVSGQIAGFIAQ
jgi:hypothetical protein